VLCSGDLICLLWSTNGVLISEKTAFCIVTAVKTSNLTWTFVQISKLLRLIWKLCAHHSLRRRALQTCSKYVWTCSILALCSRHLVLMRQWNVLLVSSPNRNMELCSCWHEGGLLAHKYRSLDDLFRRRTQVDGLTCRWVSGGLARYVF
jgi:hypothetical protein